MAIQISGTTVIDNSRNVNAGVVTATSFFGNGAGLTGIKLTSTVAGTSLGTSIDGGFLICKNNGLGLIVSPCCAEVSRSWYRRDDAVVQSGCCTAGTQGWFVPTLSQLQNPGYSCRDFWGPSPCFSSANYWSSTAHNFRYACRVCFANGTATQSIMGNTYCVRAFRCVTY